MVIQRRVYLLIKQLHPIRHRILQEMVETERNYLRGLAVLINEFDSPLSRQPPSLITVDERKLVFGSIGVIHSYGQELLNGLEDRFRNWQLSTRIGDVFGRMTPFLKTYSLYVQNYPQALAVVSQLNSRVGWKEFEAATLRKNRMSGSTLPSLLITPVQRVPRYMLLLRDILKHTDPQHPDFTDLNKSYEEVEKTASFINNSAKIAEKMARIAEIALRMEGCPEGLCLIQAGRKFEREGTLVLETTDGVKPRDVKVYLLSDLLLCVTERDDGLSRYVASISLDESSVDRQDDVTFSIIRDDGKDVLTELKLRCRDPTSRAEWIKSITNCIARLREQTALLYQHKHSVAAARAEQAKALLGAKYASLNKKTSLRRGASSTASSSSAVPAIDLGEGGKTKKTKKKKTAPPGADAPVSPTGSGLRKWSASLSNTDARRWRQMDPLEKMKATDQAHEELRRIEEEKLAAEEEAKAKAESGKREIQAQLKSDTKLSYRGARASLRRTPRADGATAASSSASGEHPA